MSQGRRRAGGTLYQQELFRSFATPGAQRVLGADHDVSLISSALVAEHRRHLYGPMLEVTWPGSSALLGTLRAVAEKGALLAISLPDVFDLEDPSAQEQVVRSIAGIAEAAEMQGPLVLLRRLRGRYAGDASAASTLSAVLVREADAGFTSFSLRPPELQLEDPSDLCALVRPALDMGAGVELEFEPHDAAGLVLALLDEAGLRTGAVRGVGAHDVLLGGLLVVDPLHDELPDDTPFRASLDPFLVQGIARGIGPAQGGLLLRATRRGNASRALVTGLDLLAELDDDERQRVETLAYDEARNAIDALGAAGVSDDLLESLGRELEGDLAGLRSP